MINNLKYEDDGKGVTHCFSRFNDVKQFIEDIEHSQDFNTIISLEDTEDLMYSSDFKDRFKAEYYQTKIRYEKLHKMLNKYKAGTLDFKPFYLSNDFIVGKINKSILFRFISLYYFIFLACAFHILS